MIGYDSAFIDGTLALNSFKSEFNWSQHSDHEANVISENIASLYQAGAFFGMTKLPPNSGHRQANCAEELSLLIQQATISDGRRASKFLLEFSSSELVSCLVRTEAEGSDSSMEDVFWLVLELVARPI